MLWTTFNPEQVDIDVRHPQAEAYLESILRRFQAAGIKMIRLDAVGYAIKKPGTSCFMIPETFEFIAELTAKARALGIEVLVEIHSHYLKQIEIARQVDWVYDFALPPLVLHALFSAIPGRWPAGFRSAREMRSRCWTRMTASVSSMWAPMRSALRASCPEEIDHLVETIHQRSRDQSRQATGAAANNLDLYQVNCTFLDALGGRETDYLIARALQFFAPGIPQVYYVGFLGGRTTWNCWPAPGWGATSTGTITRPPKLKPHSRVQWCKSRSN